MRGRDDWWFEEGGDHDDEPENICPRCGEEVPPGHLETDTGACITCEDADDKECDE